ncbi:MAG: hypothetical protein Q9216_006254 [Gyalolechia sp. 2 TL-2023]
MAQSSQIIELLTSEAEPGYSAYKHLCGQIVNQPRIISDLVNDHNSSDLLFCVTRHSSRFGKLLDHVFSRRNQSSRPFPLESVATETVVLLIHLLTHSQAAGVTQVFNCLLPALQPCISSRIPQLRNLMSALVFQDTLVEHLLANETGARAITLWAWSSITSIQDVATLHFWTDKLVSMVTRCVNQHGLTVKISNWEKLSDLKSLLQKLSYRHATRRPSTVAFEVPTDIRPLLDHFELEIPTSSRKVEELMERLETQDTLSILRDAVTTFPCKVCNARTHGKVDQGESKSITADSDDVISLSKFDMSIFGERVDLWEVLLSTSAWSKLWEKKRAENSQAIDKLLGHLASGEDRARFRMVPTTEEKHFKVPVMYTKCKPNLYLIWQIDTAVDRESRKPIQVVKIWEIVEKSGISQVLENVKIIQKTWSQKKVEDCCARSHSIDRRTIPVAFEDASASAESEMVEQTKIDVRAMGPDLSNLVNKSYAFTEPVLNHQLFSDMHPEFPYMLSKAEMEVVSHWKTPSLILGRSGTGKTTCLVYHLIGKYLANKTKANDRPIRQVFLTRSRRLVDRLRTYIRRSIKTLLQNSLDEGITELEGGDASEFDISKSTVLDLSGSQFPFVCTFEDFLQLLENTVITAEPSMVRMHQVSYEDNGSSGSKEGNRVDDTVESIDFAKFELDYWPRLPQNVTSQLPLPLVYAEIMGVIKGSATSISSLNPLTLEEYLHKSSRIAPNFTLESERTLVYQVFERYETLKRGRQAVDYADRVVDILRAIQTEPSLRRMLSSVFDEIYIDEVQDQRCVDITLFLHLLKDGRGFYAGGDTAQAISRDLNFRFADIKTMVFEYINRSYRSDNRKSSAQATMFKLKQNYRSHHGIVSLASFVMNLLWKAFPQTVDKLPPESGQLLGPMPIMFTACEPDILARNKLDSFDLPAKTMGFGAQQVILVRDEDTRTTLRQYGNDIGLILTILQSKGMEFDDVILYNFVSSCPDPRGLRRLPALLDAELGVFDPADHPAMCTELKTLYVACTRARNQLFMIETSDEKELSSTIGMLSQVSKGPLIRLITRDDPSFDEHLQLLYKDNATSPQQWIERGEETMADRNFDEAYRCFERAADKRGMKLVSAHRRYEEGRKLSAGSNRELATEAFEEAAALFTELKLDANAAEVFYSMGDFKRAAEIWLLLKKYDRASRMFIRAQLYTRAADCHDQAGDLEEAANVLWQGKAYDALVRYVAFHSYRKEAISLLGSFTEQERIFRQFEMYEALDDLYRDDERTQDLFQLRLQRGNLDKALQLVLSKNTAERLKGVSEEKLHLLIDYIITGRIVENARRRKRANKNTLHGLQKLAKSGHGDRLKQWQFSLDCLAGSEQADAPSLMEIKEERLRFVVAIQILNPESLSRGQSIDSLLSDALRDAIAVVKDMLMKDEVASLPDMLLACGVWKMEHSYLILPWSPLSDADVPLADEDVTAKVTNEEFKKRFLGIRRHWQERLIREITWISAFEQDDEVLDSTMATILRGKSFASVAAGLEALLFYRLRNEWGERKEFSSLLEQMQLATTLDKRFSRALSYILRSEPYGGRIWGHLNIVRKLENDVANPNVSTFFNNLDEFRTQLNQLEKEAFESLHSLTMIFEYLTTHIIFKISKYGFIVPRSWITLHVSRLCEAGSHLKLVQPSEVKQYQHCLVKLTRSFCEILKWLDDRFPWRSDFWVGNWPYKITLLHQRNAEILAVARLNLELSGADAGLLTGIKTAINETLALDSIRKQDLAYAPTVNKAWRQLVDSAAAYERKNPLVEFRTTTQPSPQSYAIRAMNVTSTMGVVTLEQLLARKSIKVQHPSFNPGASTINTESEEDRFTTEQIKCIERFQQLWRRRASRLRQQRLLLMRSSKHRQIARFQQLTAASPPSLRVCMRFFLTKRGVEIMLDFLEVQTRFSAVHKAVKAAVDTASESAYDKIGQALGRCDGIQENLEAAAVRVSDDELSKIIDKGDVVQMKAYLERVQSLVGKVKGEMVEVEDIFPGNVRF